jgi:hypothetical protein
LDACGLSRPTTYARCSFADTFTDHPADDRTCCPSHLTDRKAKKRLGQHFLSDPQSWPASPMRCSNVEETVLEIGPPPEDSPRPRQANEAADLHRKIGTSFQH